MSSNCNQKSADIPIIEHPIIIYTDSEDSNEVDNSIRSPPFNYYDHLNYLMGLNVNNHNESNHSEQSIKSNLYCDSDGSDNPEHSDESDRYNKFDQCNHITDSEHAYHSDESEHSEYPNDSQDYVESDQSENSNDSYKLDESDHSYQSIGSNHSEHYDESDCLYEANYYDDSNNTIISENSINSNHSNYSFDLYYCFEHYDEIEIQSIRNDNRFVSFIETKFQSYQNLREMTLIFGSLRKCDDKTIQNFNNKTNSDEDNNIRISERITTRINIDSIDRWIHLSKEDLNSIRQSDGVIDKHPDPPIDKPPDHLIDKQSVPSMTDHPINEPGLLFISRNYNHNCLNS